MTAAEKSSRSRRFLATSIGSASATCRSTSAVRRSNVSVHFGDDKRSFRNWPRQRRRVEGRVSATSPITRDSAAASTRSAWSRTCRSKFCCSVKVRSLAACWASVRPIDWSPTNASENSPPTATTTSSPTRDRAFDLRCASSRCSRPAIPRSISRTFGFISDNVGIVLVQLLPGPTIAQPPAWRWLGVARALCQVGLSGLQNILDLIPQPRGELVTAAPLHLIDA